MQEKSLYEKVKKVVNHLYNSIVLDENSLKSEILKRRIDFIRNEIIFLGEELSKTENELTLCSINKELDNLNSSDEFNDFKE